MPFTNRLPTKSRQKTSTKYDDQKRGFDIVVTGFAILVLSPLLAFVALAVRLSSRGPVFFMQQRVGRDGQLFSILKFRTMYQDAEERRHTLLASSDRSGVCFKAKNDPRVTPVGRVLRRYSLDELPQLFNVLRGEMSLVGPRPAIQSEVDAYPAKALDRLESKPGITGIWQVSGRADINFSTMVDMDVAYTRSKSLVLDFMILALTARAVLTGKGAY